ncbi:MAG: plasmid pRiA4b ORF-3 family protein [Longimicrobiales bacterium]
MSHVLHPPVYTLHVQVEGIDPPVWRRIEVPASIPLRGLHDIIQTVFGWEGAHLHLFEIGGERYGLGDNEYDEDEHDDAAVLLGDVVQNAGSGFLYRYDFGDDWYHAIRLEQVRRDVAPKEVPRLVAGERAGPPEDCGGVPGYLELLEAITDSEHEDHAAAVECGRGAAMTPRNSISTVRTAGSSGIGAVPRRRVRRSAGPPVAPALVIPGGAM